MARAPRKTRRSLLSRFAAAALIAAPVLAVPTAMADDRRGHRGGYGHNHRDWDRGRHHPQDWRRHDRHRHHNYHHYNRSRSQLSFSLNLGRPYAYYPARPASSYYPPAPAYYPNAYGLAPHQCLTRNQWDYWRGRPAEVSVRICADRYGASYVVQGSHRLIRYQYR